MPSPPSELNALFSRIDRRVGCSAYRRLLRAVAAFNCGDDEACARELECGLMEAAYDLGMSPKDVSQLVHTAAESLRRERPRAN